MFEKALLLAVKLVPFVFVLVQLVLLARFAFKRNRNPLAWMFLGLLWSVPALVIAAYLLPVAGWFKLLFWILWAIPPLVLIYKLPPLKFGSDASTLFGETTFVRRKKQNEMIAKCFFGFMAAAMVIPLFLIVGYIVVQGAPAISWEFLTENPRSGGAKGGIWAAIVGTFYIVFFSLVISAPIGVLAAVYLNEYATENWFTRIVNLAVVNLAGVPSIVHGLFGVGAFVYFANFNNGKKSIIAAALTLAVMTLPVIIASTKEALSAVPRQFREACWNVGATRWQTIWRIVLPNSISGILTGVILQVSRTAGETAPVMLTGVATYKLLDSTGLFLYHPIKDQCMALSMHLYYIATQANNVPKATPFAIATVLIGVVLIVNAAAIAFRVYLRSRKKW